MPTWEAICKIKYGLLGKTLAHSISPYLHQLLGNSQYQLIELDEDLLPRFLKEGDWQGLNVTIPYKKTVIPYCHSLTERAQKIGAVNVLTKDAQGNIIGDNTDYEGLWDMISSQGISLKDKKVLILGSGGASATAQEVCKDMKAKEIVVISRKGEDNYQNIAKHSDCQIIINTTPVGMYPNIGEAPLSLAPFPHLQGVFDCIYNPLRSRLVLDARERNIIAIGGLEMLTTQAYEAHICFGLKAQCTKKELYETVRKKRENIIFIGMPGSGKTTVAKALAEKLSMPYYDTDNYIETQEHMSVEDIFAKYGEGYFREKESLAIKELCKHAPAVIASGGGSVLKKENRLQMQGDGRILWLKRDRHCLQTEGRPLSKGEKELEEMENLRNPIYASMADIQIENKGTVAEVVAKIQMLL